MPTFAYRQHLLGRTANECKTESLQTQLLTSITQQVRQCNTVDGIKHKNTETHARFRCSDIKQIVHLAVAYSNTNPQVDKVLTTVIEKNQSTTANFDPILAQNPKAQQPTKRWITQPLTKRFTAAQITKIQAEYKSGKANRAIADEWKIGLTSAKKLTRGIHRLYASYGFSNGGAVPPGGVRP